MIKTIQETIRLKEKAIFKLKALSENPEANTEDDNEGVVPLRKRKTRKKILDKSNVGCQIGVNVSTVNQVVQTDIPYSPEPSYIPNKMTSSFAKQKSTQRKRDSSSSMNSYNLSSQNRDIRSDSSLVIPGMLS